MENLVEIKNNQIVTTSRQVADSFGKQHKHVLESIQGILHSAEKSAQWFYETGYKDASGKSNKMYLMNRDGFSLLVMGFNGKDAMKWKVEYIEAFNAMEKAIKTPQLAPNPKYRTRMIGTALRDVENTRKALQKMFKVQDGLAYAKALSLIEPAYGVNLEPIKELLPPAEKATGFLTPTALGMRLGGIKAKNVNIMLADLNFQHRDGKYWRLNEAGIPYGEEIGYKAQNGHEGYSIKWSEVVVGILQPRLETAGA